MILLNSCSIIDVHAYPERKQNNFYYNIKTEVLGKFVETGPEYLKSSARTHGK